MLNYFENNINLDSFVEPSVSSISVAPMPCNHLFKHILMTNRFIAEIMNGLIKTKDKQTFFNGRKHLFIWVAN